MQILAELGHYQNGFWWITFWIWLAILYDSFMCLCLVIPTIINIEYIVVYQTMAYNFSSWHQRHGIFLLLSLALNLYLFARNEYYFYIWQTGKHLNRQNVKTIEIDVWCVVLVSCLIASWKFSLKKLSARWIWLLWSRHKFFEVIISQWPNYLYTSVSTACTYSP